MVSIFLVHPSRMADSQHLRGPRQQSAKAILSELDQQTGTTDSDSDGGGGGDSDS